MKPLETASSVKLQLDVIQETAANSSKLNFECPVRYFVSLGFPLPKPCETRTNHPVIIETPGKPAQTCRFSLGITIYTTYHPILITMVDVGRVSLNNTRLTNFSRMT
jgi:hypothetical protein